MCVLHIFWCDILPQIAFHCWCRSCTQSAALPCNLTWPGVVHKVIFALVDKVSTDHFISLRPLEGSYACAAVASSHAARCPNRALVNDAVRKHCGRTLWMTSCSFEGRVGNRIARRSSRTTPATESQLLYPVPGTQEHRCAVFTHRADRGGVCLSPPCQRQQLQ